MGCSALIEGVFCVCPTPGCLSADFSAAEVLVGSGEQMAGVVLQLCNRMRSADLCSMACVDHVSFRLFCVVARD